MSAEWSIEHLVDECHMHIEAMRLIIKGVQGTKKPDPEILRTLNYAMDTLRARRANLHHVAAALDRASPKP